MKNKEFECESGRCIPIEWVGNSVDDCPSGSDERQTRVSCHVEGYFSCLDARRCLPLKYLCDGVQNCDDASDETDLCPDPLLFTCLGSQKSDPVPWSITFRHTESKKLVCRDGSHMKTEFLPGFKCRVELERSDLKRVLVPQFYLKNNVSVCADGSDSCDDENCITCLDGSTVISKAQVCDGQVDCADSSDECVCENVKATVTCNETFLGINPKGSFINTTLCDENDVGCNDKMTKPKHNEDIKLDNSFYTCLDYDVINAKNDPKNFNKNAKFCDGVVECANKDDECSTRCRNEVFLKHVNITIEKWMDLCHSKEVYETECTGLMYFVESEGRLENKLPSRSKTYIYDDMYTKLTEQCTQKLNEYCDVNVKNSSICQWRFDCRNSGMQNIELSSVCDYKVDCEGSRDERICPNSTHFKCWYEDKYIPRGKYLDGHQDCQDRSDECQTDALSSPRELIKNNFLRKFVWVSAVVTVAANSVAICLHLKKLRKLRCRHSMPYANTLLISHLSLADLVMGISLLLVSVKSNEYSGDYCFHDYRWRSSSACTFVGVLTMVSSQTSMNVLVLLTGLRLYVTFRPFMSNQVSAKLIHSLCLLSWLIAGFLAILPIWRADIFTKGYFVEPNMFFNRQYVSKDAYTKYNRVSRSILDALNSSSTLNDFPERRVKVIREFGYYSSSGVCFPDLFSRETPEFYISFAIVTYNLVALLFIATTYFYIFLTYNKKPMLGTEKQQRLITKSTKTLKRRIIFIIVTDAISWVPIIAFAILSYSGKELPGVVHPLSSIVLLPINSALNPVIYSRFDRVATAVVVRFWKSTKLQSSSVRRRNFTVSRQKSNGEATMVTTI